MDSHLILECFAGTLQADLQLRNQCEKNLKELSSQQGFLECCLNLLNELTTPTHIKKAIAVYFKNRITRFWKSKDEQTHPKIGQDEKNIIKDRILPTILVVDYNIKQQLIPVLRLLIAIEFDKWDSLLDQIGQLLSQSQNSEQNLYTAMLCFNEITRKFKWSDNPSRETKLYPIINQAFPYILNIGKSIINDVTQGRDITEIQAEIIKLILKCYKFVTYYDLPEPLRVKDQVFQWGEFHASVINLKPPSYVTNSSLSEQEKSFLQISKCYKWAIANVLRLFTRYASSNTLSKKVSYKGFHELFITDFIPHFIQQFLTITEEYCHGERWLSITTLYQLLDFLSHCIVEKPTWTIIHPYFDTLITHLVYPTVCPTDQVLEIYEEDPQEYIHLCFDSTSGFENPESAAIGFFITALYKRKKSCWGPVSNLINSELSTLQQQEETLDVAKKKEGLLRILGSISGYIPKDEFVEQIISKLVIPNLNSKHEFLKARTIEVLSQFSEIDFQDKEILSNLIQGILKNFDDPNSSLPVQFNSALSIQAFIVKDEFKQVLSTIVLPTMSKLLNLSNEIDNDAISVVMQECVENFSEQLQPFGVDLMSKLVQQFLKLAVEIHEASKVDIDEFDSNYDDQTDKQMAALGFLNTMITVLLSFENSQEICHKLEEIFSPAIEYVLINQMDEFFAETGELIENSTFLLRSISPIMWNNFKLLFNDFENGSALMYIEELMPCLQNYLIYGKSALQSDDTLVQSMVIIFQLMTADSGDDLGVIDLILAYEFAQTLILCLENKAEPLISKFLEIVLSNDSINDKRKLNSSYSINSYNVIIASIVYCYETTLSILSNSNFLIKFLTNWFNLIPELQRVYDLKLSLLALVSLSKISNIDQQIHDSISIKYITLLKKLSTAIPNLDKKRKNIDEINSNPNFEFNEEIINRIGGNEDDDDDWEEDFEDIEANEANQLEDNDETNNDEATQQYIEFLNSEDSKLQNSGFFDQSEETVHEDPLQNTPLDEINPFEIFKDYLKDLQTNQISKFQSLFGNLNEDDQKLIIDLINL
ncbi:NMD5 [Candida pseudojiufengensis]|uniref:NMD5 n=1 Tax=Candida pseudojiufengensis TaxID=497109 RepID=UPI00222431E2|nr:NMD5 [Candida pseudojiufengensis]KAI5959429.1 NMD5 [Candida pseudojiufengensis]